MITIDPKWHSLELKKIEHLTNSASTFIFSNPGLQWQAGQYMAFILPDVSSILEQYEHWFTISSAPYMSDIHITVRHSSSPFKQRLLAMRPGDTLYGHTVDGDFCWPLEQDVTPIFIAGGIGVTPFISMLRQRMHEGRSLRATLFYFNRTSEWLFRDELETMSSIDKQLVTHYINEKPLSLEPVLARSPELQDTIAYLAGPVPMVDRLGQALQGLGVPIKQDWYFGYDITSY